MIPINKKKLHEMNAHLVATSSRAVCEQRLIEWDERNPTIPCPTCNGKSTFIVHVDGTRDHDIAKASAAKGDRAVPCESCKGWGFKRVTPAEFIAHHEAKNDGIRAEYRTIMGKVCEARGMTKGEFTAKVQRKLPPNPNAPAPADWLRAAKEFARAMGVE